MIVSKYIVQAHFSPPFHHLTDADAENGSIYAASDHESVINCQLRMRCVSDGVMFYACMCCGVCVRARSFCKLCQTFMSISRMHASEKHAPACQSSMRCARVQQLHRDKLSWTRDRAHT